jgi:SsrA-binding protein
MVQQKSSRQIAENRKAYHDYYIEERMEAGLELKGTEVKSLRQGRVNLSDSYAAVRDGELWLVGMHISP